MHFLSLSRSLNSAALNCDCSLRWFPVWIKQFGERFSIKAYCDGTSELMSGTNILHVNYNNITCGESLITSGFFFLFLFLYDKYLTVYYTTIMHSLRRVYQHLVVEVEVK